VFLSRCIDDFTNAPFIYNFECNVQNPPVSPENLKKCSGDTLRSNSLQIREVESRTIHLTIYIPGAISILLIPFALWGTKILPSAHRLTSSVHICRHY